MANGNITVKIESVFTKEERQVIEAMANCALLKVVFNNPMYKQMATDEQLKSILEKVRKM